MKLVEALKNHKLIADGSFGTYFASKHGADLVPELSNITHPEWVCEIHKEYILAGACLVRTNTFAAYVENLGKEVDVKAVRTAAVNNAIQAVSEAKKLGAEQEVYIAGDIGPAPFDIDKRDDIACYREIAEDLIQAGCDLLVFETFSDMEEIYPVIQELKIKYPELFILVSFAVNQYGYSTTGCSAARLVQRVATCSEIDAVGLNCGIGPAHMSAVVNKLGNAGGKYISIFPNAGYPKLVRDRVFYSDNTGYFVEKMNEIAQWGADILGGCCGTKPEHIRVLADTVDCGVSKSITCAKFSGENIGQGRNEAFFAGKNTGEKLIAVELVPPLNADDEAIIKSAEYLKHLGVDALTFPDSPSGRTRVDSVLMADKVAKETGLCVIPHLSCRDKNAIAMRSQIMGAYINNIYNLLVITGDPVPVTERGQIKSVFNFDSVKLMRMISDMNYEFFAEAPMVYGGAINQGRLNIDAEIKRVRRKIDNGTSFFMSQPVFTIKDAECLRRIKSETGARILCGIMPLISRKNALFMKNEISGIGIDDEIVELFPENVSREQGEQIGVSLARKAMEMCNDFADGYYFSFPFNRVHLLERLLKK